ncbi:MAG TPA: glycosyltransferase family 4 protein [Burkholderiales bacterium]|nr:glycosyltransferase family 4 protein [Burkholderiales bacterium]
MKVLFFANTEWYLYNFRLAFAKFLRDRGFEVVMVSPVGPYGARLVAEGFRWIGLDMDRRSIHPGRELSVLYRLSKIYAAEKPDIVHHFTIKCVVYGSLIAWRLGIRKRVNAVAGMGYVFTSTALRARLLKPFVAALMKLLVRGSHARLIIQNNDDFSAFQTARVAPPANIRLIRGSGVDTSRFRPRGQPRSGRTRVLFAARLLRDKGIGEYVEAARILKRENIAVDMLIAGLPDSGNPSSVAPEQIEQWLQEGCITHLGHVDDMPALLSDVDIAVLPSYREGAPRSLIEAAAAGLPIVSTDVPGCREVVEHQVNGLLVPVRQAEPIVEAIRFLHQQPLERVRMGQAGREKMLRQFDQRLVFEATHAVYLELIAQPAPKSSQNALQAR